MPPRVQTELLGEDPPAVLVDGQGVRLSPRTRQRRHQQGPQAFPERMRGDERSEVGDHPGVSAEGQFRLGAFLCRGQSQVPVERLIGEDGAVQPVQHRTPPQSHRRAQQRHRLIRASLGGRLARAADVVFSHARVEPYGVRAHPVTASDGLDHVPRHTERPPQVRHADGDLRPHRGRRGALPDHLRQAVHRGHPAGVQEQRRQHQPGAPSSQRHRPALHDGLQRPQDPKLHLAHVVPRSSEVACVQGGRFAADYASHDAMSEPIDRYRQIPAIAPTC